MNELTMIPVVTGGYPQFLQFVHAQEESKGVYKYIFSTQDLRGYYFNKVIFYGTYWLNPMFDSYELNHTLAMREIEKIYADV